MDDLNKTSYDEKNVFNCVRLKNYLGEELTVNKDKVFICGTMNGHSTQAKYSFKACDFLIYSHLNNKLFHSEMKSDDCFTTTLKWNNNFFKKIRLCLESPDWIKNTYFSIDYEKKAENLNDKNDLIVDLNSYGNGDNNEKEDEGNEIDLEFTDRKIYLELHFLVETQDIIAFRLLLKHTIEDKPEMIIMSKFLEYENIESEKYNKKVEKAYEKEKEIIRMESEINKQTENLEKRKKQYLYKFYYLNKEKNKKIIELSGVVKKEKKLFL